MLRGTSHLGATYKQELDSDVAFSRSRRSRAALLPRVPGFWLRCTCQYLILVLFGCVCVINYRKIALSVRFAERASVRLRLLMYMLLKIGRPTRSTGAAELGRSLCAAGVGTGNMTGKPPARATGPCSSARPRHNAKPQSAAAGEARDNQPVEPAR